MSESDIYEQQIEHMALEISKLHARVYFLEREANKYKRLYESRERKKETMKASTQQSIIDNIEIISAFASGLIELYDFDRDGDDYWHGYKLPDGSYVDINIYVFSDGDKEWLNATAYPIWGDGQINTSHGVTVKSIELV
jgi:hypothetical protein